jgi:hypothetical protein
MALVTRFTRLTPACLLGVLLLGGLSNQEAADVGTTIRVSADRTGRQENGPRFRSPALSANGRFMGFRRTFSFKAKPWMG